jgi:hypothetical protein
VEERGADCGTAAALASARRTALITLILAVTVAPGAAAQDEGPIVDPDTPAGKEYALPLEQERREAAPGASGQDGDGAGEQPLFGIGIDGSRGARGSEGSGSAGAGNDGTGAQGTPGQPGQGDVQERPRSGDASSRAGDLAPNAYRPAAIEAAASEGSDALVTAGIAAAVLAAGLLAGFGLRRLLRESHHPS